MKEVYYIYQRSGFYSVPDIEIECYDTKQEAEYELKVLEKYDPQNEYYIYKGKEVHHFYENADGLCYRTDM